MPRAGLRVVEIVPKGGLRYDLGQQNLPLGEAWQADNVDFRQNCITTRTGYFQSNSVAVADHAIRGGTRYWYFSGATQVTRTIVACETTNSGLGIFVSSSSAATGISFSEITSSSTDFDTVDEVDFVRVDDPPKLVAFNGHEAPRWWNGTTLRILDTIVAPGESPIVVSASTVRPYETFATTGAWTSTDPTNLPVAWGATAAGNAYDGPYALALSPVTNLANRDWIYTDYGTNGGFAFQYGTPMRLYCKATGQSGVTANVKDWYFQVVVATTAAATVPNLVSGDYPDHTWKGPGIAVSGCTTSWAEKTFRTDTDNVSDGLAGKRIRWLGVRVYSLVTWPTTNGTVYVDQIDVGSPVKEGGDVTNWLVEYRYRYIDSLTGRVSLPSPASAPKVTVNDAVPYVEITMMGSADADVDKLELYRKRYDANGVPADEYWMLVSDAIINPGADGTVTYQDTPDAIDQSGPLLNETDCTPPINLQYAVTHEGRIFASRKDSAELCVSDYKSPCRFPDLTDVDVEQDTGGGRFVVDGGQSGHITALLSDGKRLFIWTQSAMFQLSGDSFANFRLECISRSTGCAARRSVAKCEEWIVFLSNHRNVMAYGPKIGVEYEGEEEGLQMIGQPLTGNTTYGLDALVTPSVAAACFYDRRYFISVL